MKKFLSVLLTMAMVMSLFGGTVLAAPGDNIKAITFSKDYVVDSVDTEVKVILEPNVGKTIGNTVTWTLLKGTDVFDTGSASTFDSATTGYKEFYLSTTRLAVANGEVEQTYTLFVEDDATGVAAASVFSTITARHPLSVNGSTAVPVVKLNVNTTFAGVITGGKDLYVALLKSGTVVASTQANASGEFSLNRTFTEADKYAIGLRKGPAGSFTSYLDVAFEPKEDTKISNTIVPVATRDDDGAVGFKTVVTVAPLANAPALPAEANTFVEMTLPNGDKVKMPIDGGATAHEYSYTFATDTLKAGTYTITAVTFDAAVKAETKLSDIKLPNFVALRKAGCS